MAGRPSQRPPRTVAAFDFDRTLSARDTFLPFLRTVSGPWALRAALLRVTPDLARSVLGERARRDVAKATIVRSLLRGKDAELVEQEGRRFSERILDGHLRADVLERVTQHRARGDELVIVSASLGAYLRPVGDALGFDAVLATELATGADGRLTGALQRGNVRGAEKVRRLDEWLGGAPAVVWAYGDGASDRELLARADHPVRVGRRPLRGVLPDNP